jgi:hypothetical protein
MGYYKKIIWLYSSFSGEGGMEMSSGEVYSGYS